MSYQRQRPIPFGSRNLPYDFRARTALAGLGRLRRGLGLTCPPGQNPQGPNSEFPQGVCLLNCGDTSIYSSVGAQFACEQQNQAAINAAGYEGPVSSPTGYTSAGNCAQYPNAPGCAQAPSSSAVAPPPAPPPTYSPRVSFATSRGGNTVYPGDTWTISISGGQPNAAVSVLGIHPDGGSATQGYGNTDGSGNFQLAGTITADMLGKWQETWSVGGQQAGSFSFTVNPTPQQSAATPPAGSSPTGSGQQLVTGPQVIIPPTSTDGISSFISGIPWWGWAIAAGGALFMFSGGKR